MFIVRLFKHIFDLKKEVEASLKRSSLDVHKGAKTKKRN